ncbi:MAG: NUDIX domain-containing protein [Tannerella sp.]|jgi:8-oxo-dGTP diphosphatase|nr:NUDIX domain-containing protein [Tannerella sp.]
MESYVDVLNFPHPYTAVDCAVFGYDEKSKELKVLLVKRDSDQTRSQGQWALPGGFMNYAEDADAEDCIKRQLHKKTKIASENFHIEQFYTFTDRERDKDWIISIAHFALIKLSDFPVTPGTFTSDVQWFSLTKTPDLAFDHNLILNKAFEQLKRKLRYQPIGFELLPHKFTMPQLHNLYEIVLQEKLDRRNFRKKILSTELLNDCNETKSGLPHKAPKLYEFNREKYKKLVDEGFYFELKPSKT